MLLLYALVALAVLSVLWYFYERTVKPKNYPPGPEWHPITGSTAIVAQLVRSEGGIHKAFHQLSQIYRSDIVGMKDGNRLTVCVYSNDLLRDVLTRDEFQARPITFFSTLRSMGTNKGITFTNGEHWARQRQFLVRQLRDLGFGKQKMDAMIADECRTIIESLHASNRPQRIGIVIGTSVLNVLWALVAGERLDCGDGGRLHHLLALMSRRAKSFDLSGGWLNLFPWLRFVAPRATGYQLIVQINAELRALMMTVIDEHKAAWWPGRNDDFIFAFLSEMHTGKDDTFTDDQLVMLCVDVFIGGSTTTSSTLDFAFMCMIMHPTVQERVHRELDAAYPNCSMPQYKDRQRLPYVEAVICEVMRYYYVAAISGPRLTLQDTTLGGYSIPEGTTVFLCNYSVYHDPKLWKDPETFRPERFLDEEGNLSIPNHLNPFNIGKRKCPADLLARNCIFTFFAGVMKTFAIGQRDDEQPLDGRVLPGMTLSPAPYIPTFTRRKL